MDFLEQAKKFFDWKTANVPKRRQEIASTMRALDGPGRAIPDCDENPFRTEHASTRFDPAFRDELRSTFNEVQAFGGLGVPERFLAMVLNISVLLTHEGS